MVHSAQLSARLTLAAILLGVTGCSSAATPAPTSGASSLSPSASTSATNTPEPASTSAAANKASAHQVFDDIAKQVPQAKLVKVYNEDNDPNKLLGRPNGYTSKIAFSDSRVDADDVDGADKDAVERGGSIEVFPDADLAKGRAAYIQSVLKNSGLGAEFDYVRGAVLVRVTGNLTPSKAKIYQEALD